MSTPLRALMIEDAEDDAVLLAEQLRKGGYQPAWERVETREALEAALVRQEWDVLFADYALPHFGGVEGIRLVRAAGLDFPCLMVSGTEGEDAAVEAMRAGAQDFLVKSNLSRLVPAVQRELREARMRRERRGAQEALEAAHTQMAEILESISDAFYTVDEEWRFVYVNRRTEELWGKRRNELIGKSIWEAFPELVGSEPYERVMAAARQGRPAHFEAVSPILGRWIDTSVYPSRWGLSIYFRDVTERKEAEAGQRLLAEAGTVLASSLDYEKTLEQVAWLAVPRLADWCFVDLLQGEERFHRLAVAYADPSQAELARALQREYPARRDLPRGISKVLRTHQSDLMPEVNEEDLRAIARDAEHLEAMHALGLRTWMSVPLTARGNLLGVLSLVGTQPERRYDANELALAEELGRRAAIAIDNSRLYHEAVTARAAAEEASQSKEDFISVVSHELRNPLAAIQAGVQLLAQTIPDGGRVKRTLEILQRNADLQTRLVNDLLDLGRITRGKIRIQRERVALDAVVRAAVLSTQEEARAADLTLETNITPEVCVCGDFDRLQQVVANLLSNAIKFTRPGGRVAVSCEAHGPEHARIIVEDNGVGMEPELSSHLFEMFRQGEEGKRRQGLGIGLALVKLLVELHGGRVWGESGGAGQGSRFTVELPMFSAGCGADDARLAQGGH